MTDSYAQLADEATAAERHARAIEILRAGEHENATTMLGQLYEESPESAIFLNDYIVALSWSQQDAAALALEPQLNVQTTPLYVIDADREIGA